MARRLSGRTIVARKRCGPTGSVVTVAARTSSVRARYARRPTVIPPAGCEDVLSAGALDFLAALVRRFEPRRRELLERRRLRQAELDAGSLPDFLPETKDVRDRAWTVAPIPPDLRDRRVEITGPVD